MALLPAPTSEHYAAQQRLVVGALNLTRSVWGRMDMADLDASWNAVAPVLTKVVYGAQLAAARNGASYVGPTLEALGEMVKPVALVRPQGFAGFASDGRPLTSLLEGAKVYAKQSNSLEAAGKWLDMTVHTQVQDAARQAASVDMMTRPGVGYVRTVNPPCCQRCAVLAGRFFRANAGFKRHPRCDCFHVPTTIAHPNGFGQSIDPDQIKDLTAAQRAAIRDGADMNQVINSHRAGARSSDGMTTSAGGKRGQVRMTPEGIYRVSATREEALERLRQNGYVLDTKGTANPVKPDLPRVTVRPAPVKPAAPKPELAPEPQYVDKIAAALRSGHLTEKELLSQMEKASDLGKVNARAALEQIAREEAERAARGTPRTFSSAQEARDWANSHWAGPEGYAPDELKAMRDYTGSGYGPMNNTLRSSKGARGNAKTRAMDAAIERAARVPDDIVVVRNANLRQFGITASRTDPKSIVGGEFVDHGYLSTSINRTGAMQGDVRVTINVPKGSRGVYVSGNGGRKSANIISDYGGGESELILDRGSILRVKSVRKVGKRWHVEADLVQRPRP